MDMHAVCAGIVAVVAIVGFICLALVGGRNR